MTNKKPGKSKPTQEQWDWFLAHFTHDIRRRLRNEAYRILQNSSDVDDIMQTSIEIASCHLANLRHEESFYSWMFKIVRREAYHLLIRQGKMSYAKSRLLIMMDHYTASTTPDKITISKEERERLWQEIDRLKSPDKEIMLLKLTTDKSLKKIAEELGLNYHTTRSKYTRMCKLIKQRLDD